MRATIATLLILSLCAAGFVALKMRPASGQPQADDAAALQDLAFRPHPGARLPLDIITTDEAGRARPLSAYFGRTPVIVVLEYLKCRSLCTVTLENLVDSLNRLPLTPARDYQLVALSIDPRDTPQDAAAARNKYAGTLERSDASGLHFLVAGEPEIRKISETIGFPHRYDKLLDAYIHPAGFVIASADGVIRRYVEGAAIAPQEFVAALADAQQNRTVGWFARVVLLCHVESVPIGRFTVPVMAALMAANLAAGLTLIAVFTALRRKG
jgi:protein SCO1/2